MRCAAFVVLACLVGCAASKPRSVAPVTEPNAIGVLPPAVPTCSTEKPIEPLSPMTIVRVEMVGNKRIALADICHQLRTRAGDAIDEGMVARDIRNLFSTGLFDDILVASPVSSAGRIVTFTVRERAVIRELSVVGATNVVNGARLNELLPKAGDVLEHNTLRGDVAKVRAEYVSLGYREATVDFLATPIGENQVDLRIEIVPGKRQLIAAVRFPGASQMMEAELLAAVDSGNGKYNAPGGIFLEEALERSLLSIDALYFDRGMVMVKVLTPELTVSPTKDALTLTIPIEEGPIFKMGKLMCVGDLVGTEKDCLSRFGMKKGDVFSRQRIVEGIERIRAEQAKLGRGTQIDPDSDVDQDTKTVGLTITVSP